MRFKLILATLSLVLALAPAQAGVAFTFNFTDGAGVGFNDNTQGAARRAALAQAGSIVGSLFGRYNATITIDVDGAETTDGTLAAAGSNYHSATPPTGFGNRGDVMLKILNGNAADPAPSLADGSVTWNFQDNLWELGTSFQANEFDFISTAAHELFHLVGFGSDISLTGRDLLNTAPGTAGRWSPFDRWVAGATGSIINSTDFKLDITKWNTASVGGAGAGLRFVGPNTLAANGGNPLFLFSPNPWQEGSSGSHLDDDFYHATYIMESATDPGLGIRTFSALEQAMLRDIGYTLVPEPTSALLLLGSLGLMFVRRARPA